MCDKQPTWVATRKMPFSWAYQRNGVRPSGTPATTKSIPDAPMSLSATCSQSAPNTRNKGVLLMSTPLRCNSSRPTLPSAVDIGKPRNVGFQPELEREVGQHGNCHQQTDNDNDVPRAEPDFPLGTVGC